MPRPPSRRAFLAISVTGLLATACSSLRPSLTHPGAASPTSDRATPGATPSPGASPLRPIHASPDGYVVVAPRILRPRWSEPVSVALFKGVEPAADTVEVSLLQGEKVVARISGTVAGQGPLALAVPPLAEGEYTLQVQGSGYRDQTPVRVEGGALLFVETDKPIYRPGQTIHLRALLLDPSLKPVAGEVVVEAVDAKGAKIFRKVVAVDDGGMATLDLPLSSEPNLGTWKIAATSGNRSSQLDVRVERYVLPKYEVKLELARTWVLASEPIRGTVTAAYSFGKPVVGEVVIEAFRYVGVWQAYARLTHPIDGKVAIEVPPARDVAGSPADGGQARVRLDVTVREQATGYEEKTSELVTVAASPVTLRLIPETTAFKPGLPFSVLVVAESPDKKPVDLAVDVRATYQDASFRLLHETNERVVARGGVGLLRLTPPQNAVTLLLQPSGPGATGAPTTVRASFSPSGSFVHLEQVSRGSLKVGDTVRFKVHATGSARTTYYEVLARGSVVFSDVVSSGEIAFALTPAMAPQARLLAYQLLPNAEVAADHLPLSVDGDYPHRVAVGPGQPEVRPGEEVEVAVQTEGPARVGLAAVDRSVFILAENRLNLQQVFDELERLFLKPRVELHDLQPLRLAGGVLPGARDVFDEAGVTVLSNRQVPPGKTLTPPGVRALGPGPALQAAAAAPMAAPAAPAAREAASAGAAADASLAPVQRVRQFFPETWVWTDLTTDASGRARSKLTAPDSITTWSLRAVALSKAKGLGVGEAELRVFQPFFVQVDRPYAAVWGEVFPVKVALYNYSTANQDVIVDLAAADWFERLDAPSRTVSVAPNSVGTASFAIRPTALGSRSLTVTARSPGAADSILKEVLIEPEGVAREIVESAVVTAGAARELAVGVPSDAVPGSARRFVSITGNALTQTIEGLDQLLQLPFGCGEQNMILFAPDVFVARYLKDTRQLKPEVMARAEKLMLTGYQRELTYRRPDGSFSAFGASDPEGSLWLTAFVLKTLAQARDLIFVDEGVLASARDWIRQHQQADGSFDPVGFLHHQELLGGLRGKVGLTAYVAIALREAGDAPAADRAVRYLESQLATIGDAYGVAIATYALALSRSSRAAAARDQLLARAHVDSEGLWWGDGAEPPAPLAEPVGRGNAATAPPNLPRRTAAIETTAYAALALLQLGAAEAERALRWLATKRNAAGGFGSTQDTVVALQALATAASVNRSTVDATVTLRAGGWTKEVRVGPDTADVLQIVDLPATDRVSVDARGIGPVLVQAIARFNAPAVPEGPSAFQLDVRYGAERVEVDDLVHVVATVRFTPPEPISAGMVVLDVGVPTGFAAVAESLQAAAMRQPKLKRWDVAGRKVIFYLDDLYPDEQIVVEFDVRALSPVRTQPVASRAYAYYRPEWRGESLAGAMAVGSG